MLKYISLCIILFLQLCTSRASALETTAPLAFVEEEGEYLSDQMWDNWDWFNVGIDAGTSGGQVTYELYKDGLKYALHTFFCNVSLPLEFWLDFIQHWRYEQGLNAPEELRVITEAILDQRIDITWLACASNYLTKREGWQNVGGMSPFAIADPAAELAETDGDWTPASSYLKMQHVPPVREAANTTVDSTAAAYAASGPGSLTDDMVKCVSARTQDTLLFETLLNKGAQKGYFSELGVPKGCLYLDAKWCGIRGPDGFFVHPDGRVFNLEYKMAGDLLTNRAGSLGKIKVTSHLGAHRVYQTSPQWQLRAFTGIYEYERERFVKLTKAANQSGGGLKHALDLAQHIAVNKEAIAKDIFLRRGGKLSEWADKGHAMRAMVEYWMVPEEIVKSLRKTGTAMYYPAERLEEVGKFFARDYCIGVVNVSGRKVRYANRIQEITETFCRKLGYTKAISREVLKSTGVRKLVAR